MTRTTWKLYQSTNVLTDHKESQGQPLLVDFYLDIESKGRMLPFPLLDCIRPAINATVPHYHNDRTSTDIIPPVSYTSHAIDIKKAHARTTFPMAILVNFT